MSALALVPVWGGFLSVAPNRIAPARLVAPADAPGWAWVAVHGVLVALAVAASLGRGGIRLRAAAIAAALACLLLGLGWAAATQVTTPLARAAPSGAVWLAAASLLAALFLALRALPRHTAATGWLVLGAGVLALALAGHFDALSLAREARLRRDDLAAALGDHMRLALAALVPALAIGGALGVMARRRPGILAALAALQVVPAMALFALLMAPLGALGQAVPVLREFGVAGIGPAPAVLGVMLYLLLPIAASTAAALDVAPAAVLEAARAMGMGPGKVLREVRLPLGLPLILAGARTAAVQAVGLMALGALVGAGGLGALVFQGIGQFATDLILLGALSIGLLAVALDQALGALESRLGRR